MRLDKWLPSCRSRDTPHLSRSSVAPAIVFITHQDELTKMLVTWEGRLAEEKRTAGERARELLDQKADVAEKAAAQQRVTEGGA